MKTNCVKRYEEEFGHIECGCDDFICSPDGRYIVCALCGHTTEWHEGISATDIRNINDKAA